MNQRDLRAQLNAVTPAQLRRRFGSKWSTFGEDVLAAWVAEMDFPLAEPIRELLAAMVASSDVGYPTLTDTPLQRLREIFCQRMAARHAWQVDPAHVEVLTDVMQGVLACLKVVTQPGDSVIVQPPVYPPFFAAVQSADREMLLNPLVQGSDGDYCIDFDHLKASIRPNTRALLLCNPQNPSGRVFRRDELEALAALAEAHDLWLLVDEIHAEIVYSGHTHIPIASLSPEIAARTVTFTSATKAFSIPGLRCAVAVFGSPEARAKLGDVPAMLRGGTSSFGLHATCAAWTACDDWLAAVLAQLEENRQKVRRFAQAYLPQGKHPSIQATYLAWLDCRQGDWGGLAPADFFLEHAKVALGRGEDFGLGGEGFVRLNFATPGPILDAVIERLAASIERR